MINSNATRRQNYSRGKAPIVAYVAYRRLAPLVCLLLVLMGCAKEQTAPPTPQPTPTMAATPIPNTVLPQPIATHVGVPPTPTKQPTLNFDGNRAYQSVIDQVALGPRITGTTPHQQLGNQVLSHLAANGWLTRTQNFVYKNTPARNLIGVKGAQNKDIVIIGAHYDTRRKADQDPQYPNQPVPGANDGASGVAVLMELARTLEINRSDKQIWLVFFDAEDNGDLDGWDWIVGSQQFAASLTISPSAVIIVDMIGDADQEIWLERSSNLALSTEIWDIAHKLGYEQYFRKLPRWSMLDDHTPFLQRGWKAIDMIDFDYAHWHKTSDTPDKVSAQSLLRVGHTLEVWLEK